MLDNSSPQEPPDAPAERAAVLRVVCASEARNVETPYATLEHIRDAALRHNPQVGIHAALAFQSGWFVHWVEGPERAVDALCARVRDDDRHYGQRIVHLSRGPRLLMTPWSMMLSTNPESPLLMRERVLHLTQQHERGRQYAPSSVMRRLTAPMQLPEALDLPDPECYTRVGLCSAGGSEAFDLLGWLANERELFVDYRRFAGESGLDAGGAFVDQMYGAYALRLIAVARADLLHGLRRALMQDWAMFALLLCNDPERNASLLDRVEEAFEGAMSVPEIVLVGFDGDLVGQALRHGAALRLNARPAPYADPGRAPTVWRALSPLLKNIEAPPASGWPTVASAAAR